MAPKLADIGVGLDLDLDLGWSQPTAIDRAINIVIGGRDLSAGPVFNTYWKFSALRQQAYESRISGAPGPWTSDPILRVHRFTNCYRATDRVSQYLINEVAYCGSQQSEEIAFRILLFKFFNKISTWQLLERELGQLTWDGFDLNAYNSVLSEAARAGTTLYSAAYVMPAPNFGAERKHTNHLRLLDAMMRSRLPQRLQGSANMRAAFELLKKYPGIGDFLAFQFLIDLNYSTLLDFDEMDFVVAGPGARDGIRKCFGSAANGIESEVIRYMAQSQDEHFDRLGLRFGGLRGRQLQLIDCQNLFCETDKYARVAHPDVVGISRRTRIKQKYRPLPEPLTAEFPPKWGIG